MKTINVEDRKVFVNLTALSNAELERLRKAYEFKTEIANRTSGANRTYYIKYKKIELAGPLVYKSGQNLIGLVVFSIAVGLVTSSLGEEGKPLLRVVDTLNKVISRLVQYVMWYVLSYRM